LQLLISDSNIFIDMEVSNLTKKMFELPYRFAVPDILYYEELEEEHKNLLEYGLKLKRVSSKSIIFVDSVLSKYRKIGFYDKLALATARQESCPLVTGDRALREAGIKEGIEIFGTIWLVEALIKHSIITVDEAKEAYKLMRENGRRLPWEFIKKRLEIEED